MFHFLNVVSASETAETPETCETAETLETTETRETLGRGGGGGAIRNRAGTMEISGSTFIGNSSIVGGGAVGNSSVMTINNSTFSNNIVTGPNASAGDGNADNTARDKLFKDHTAAAISRS